MGTLKRIAVLMSGGTGTNLRAIHEAIQSNEITNAEITCVITDRGSIPIFPKSKWIAIYPPKNSFDDAVYFLLDAHKIDLVCMAGFLRKMEIREEWSGRILNIHPSLLPKYGGKGMYGLNVHRTVIESNEALSGCSVHIVDEEYDRGPVVAQRFVRVEADDTPETLQQRVKEEEWILYPSAIQAYLQEQYPKS